PSHPPLQPNPLRLMAVRRNESNLPTLAARSGQPPGSWSEPRAAIMAAIFGPRANLVTNATLIALAALPLFAAFLIWSVPRMQYNTQVSLTPPQPVPFSHQHHVRGLGIDSRNSHTSLMVAPAARTPRHEIRRRRRCETSALRVMSADGEVQ